VFVAAAIVTFWGRSRSQAALTPAAAGATKRAKTQRKAKAS
jgi:hypothetical protein